MFNHFCDDKDEMVSRALVLWDWIQHTERCTLNMHKTFYSIINGMLKPKYFHSIPKTFFDFAGKSFYKPKFFCFQFWMRRFSEDFPKMWKYAVARGTKHCLTSNVRFDSFWYSKNVTISFRDKCYLKSLEPQTLISIKFREF